METIKGEGYRTNEESDIGSIKQDVFSVEEDRHDWLLMKGEQRVYKWSHGVQQNRKPMS